MGGERYRQHLHKHLYPASTRPQIQHDSHHRIQWQWQVHRVSPPPSRTNGSPPGQTAAWSASNPQFTLYSHRVGPNGFKVAQVLCELGLHFRTIFLEFGTGENGIKSLAFEAINPNGRIPALVDHSANDLAVWESTAIITYIAKKHDTEFKVWAQSFEDQALIETWLAYQLSGQGPYIGQVRPHPPRPL